MDTTPTLAELARIDLDEIQLRTDGRNLFSLIENAASAPPVFIDYAADGSSALVVVI